jgi:hypothetical protein
MAMTDDLKVYFCEQFDRMEVKLDCLIELADMCGLRLGAIECHVALLRSDFVRPRGGSAGALTEPRPDQT